MKKNFLLTILVGALVVSGCNFKDFAIPEEVSVKTNASYDFTIASLDSTKNSSFDLSDKLDIYKLLTSKEDGSSGSEALPYNVYKYNDGENDCQQLLIHMPLQNIEFDFSSAFGDMDFSTAVQGFDISKEVEIPDIGSVNESKKLDLSNINSTLNSGVSFVGVLPLSGQSLTVNFASSDLFETIEYTSGKLIVDGTKMGGSPEGTLTLLYNDTELSSAQFKNGIASIDIAGKTIHSTGMMLKYVGSDVGCAIVSTIDSSSKIKKAVGVTVPAGTVSIPDTEVTIPFSLSDDIGNVTIGEGTISVALADPESWSGPVIQNWSISVEGGFNCSVSKTSPTATLDDEELHNEDITATASVTIALNDATIDFEDVPEVKVETDIKKVTAEVNLPDGFENTINQSFPLPDELTNYVSSITWKKVGFKVDYNNNLPTGNNIGLNLSSTALAISGSEQTIEAGKEGELSFINDAGLTTDFSSVTEIDVNGAITLPGAQNGKLCVTDVKPGQTYSVNLTITPVFEWDEAKVKLPDNTNYSGNFNTSLNKKAMFSSLGDDLAAKLEKIKIEKMPVYLFANIPEIGLGDNFVLGGKIKAYYATQQEGQDPVATSDEPEWLLGSETETEELDFNAMPVLTKNSNDEVTNNFGQETLDFASIFNTSSSNNEATLFLDYNVGLTGDKAGEVTINASMLEELKAQGKTSISIDVAMIISLNFNVTETIKIDLLDLINQSDEQNSGGSGSGSEPQEDKDIFGRTEATNTENYEEYLDLVDNARLKITKVKLPLKGSLNLLVDLYGDGKKKLKDIDLGDGKVTRIEIDDPGELIKVYPLTPKLELVINQGTFGLKRDTAIAGTVSLGITTNGKVKVFPMESNSNSENGGSN